ncbi:hypothetical protein LCGC14_1451870 [marine sediment metagenome]|uniref:Uncharacterized protein n=1 Tax=marine sediment metagenome TaxID=412755 RepID=A0A0F9K414_9ZZZZ
MTKIHTTINVHLVNHCWECPSRLDWFDTGKGDRCDRGKRVRIIKDIWGDIPGWCPLPDKKEEK